MTHHVILGAGPAGVIGAETIRKLAPQDSITLIGDEPEPAYSRMALPYLLMGNIDESGTYLRKSPTHFQDLAITVRPGSVQSVQAATKTIVLASGEHLNYDTLLIATGSHPVSPPIPGIDSAGVHTCWTLADARAIAERAKPGARVLQLGAGFIGCIIMEALVARGVRLSVVEMADRMEQDADAEENRDRKANTARRARFASAALNAAAAQKAMARTMRNIAQAIQDGRAKFLDAVRTRTQPLAIAKALTSLAM